MPCSKTPPGAIGVGPSWASGAYATEEECLNACKDGACCDGTTCSVKPQCQCQGAGQTFKGVGTVCESLNGACCEDGAGGPSCSIKNSCECVGDGKKFIGVGTNCDSAPCCTKCTRNIVTWCKSPACIPKFLTITYSYSMPLQFRGDFGGFYIGAFSASGSVTLRGTLPPDHQCGAYGFSTDDPTVAAQFNAGAFGVSISGTGDYSLSHYCRLVPSGQIDGPQGVRNLLIPSTGSIVGESIAIFGTNGRFEFAPAASGYCYQSGSAISSEGGGTITANVTGAYGVM